MTTEERNACFEWIKALLAEDWGPPAFEEGVWYQISQTNATLCKHVPVELADLITSRTIDWYDLDDHDTGILMQAGAANYLPIVER